MLYINGPEEPNIDGDMQFVAHYTEFNLGEGKLNEKLINRRYWNI